MSVITPAELATYLGIAEQTIPMQQAIDEAEAAVSAWLGAEDLTTDDDREDTITKGMSSDIIPMRFGLVVAVSAMTIGGTAVTLSDIQVDWWQLAYLPGVGKNAEIVVTFDRGFANMAAMPANLKWGTLFTCKWTWEQGHQGRQGTSLRLGDYTETFGDIAKSQRDTIPDHAQNLLREYRRPGMLL